MKRLFILAVLLVAAIASATDTQFFLRKYGVEATVDFSLAEEADPEDLYTGADPFAAGEVLISKDRGATANVISLPSATRAAMGLWSQTLTATEMTAAVIVVSLIDGANATEDKLLIIETYGNASALHAFDLDTAGYAMTAGAIPAAAAGAAGGLLIAGTNTGNVVIAPTAGVPLTLTAGTGNSSGLVVTGTDAGDGIKATGGATGHGMNLIGGATSGHGLYAHSTLLGYGGYFVGAGLLGSGLIAQAAGGGVGLWAIGQGSGAGLGGLGGATGNGIVGSGGETSGDGIVGSGSATAGIGIYAIGTGQQDGMRLEGNGAGSGLTAYGGSNGPGVWMAGGDGALGNGLLLSRGADVSADDLKLTNSDAPTLVTATGDTGLASITSSVNPTGSTARVIVLDTNPTTWGDLSRCWCVYYKASTALYYPGVVTSYDATAGTVTIFPSLPFTPLTADTIAIYPSMGMMIRKDFPAPNNMYFDPDINP